MPQKFHISILKCLVTTLVDLVGKKLLVVTKMASLASLHGFLFIIIATNFFLKKMFKWAYVETSNKARLIISQDRKLKNFNLPKIMFHDYVISINYYSV
jgi:hypothetical protein